MGPHEFLHEVVNAMVLKTEASTSRSQYAELSGGVRNEYRVKTTMLEHYENGNAPHDYRVTKIELIISGSSTSNALNSSISRSNEIFVSVAKLLQNVEKSYDSGNKLLR